MSKPTLWHAGCCIANTLIYAFLDESGVCLDAVARTQDWAPVGERTRRMPRERGTHKFNIIPAISTAGLVAHVIQEESVTRFDFEFFLEHILVSLYFLFTI